MAAFTNTADPWAEFEEITPQAIPNQPMAQPAQPQNDPWAEFEEITPQRQQPQQVSQQPIPQQDHEIRKEQNPFDDSNLGEWWKSDGPEIVEAIERGWGEDPTEAKQKAVALYGQYQKEGDGESFVSWLGRNYNEPVADFIEDKKRRAAVEDERRAEQAKGRSLQADSPETIALRQKTPLSKSGISEYAELLSGTDSEGNQISVLRSDITPELMHEVVKERNKFYDKAAKTPNVDTEWLEEYRNETTAMERDISRLPSDAIVDKETFENARKGQPREAFWAENMLREFKQKYGDKVPSYKRHSFELANSAYEKWLKTNPNGADGRFDRWRRGNPVVSMYDELRQAALQGRDPEQDQDVESMSEAMVSVKEYGDDSVSYFAKRTPFAGSAFTATELVLLRNAVKRIEQGSKDSSDLFIVANAVDAAEKSADRSTSKKIFDVVSQLPAFGVEFAMTGGAYTAGKKIAEKAMMKAVGKAIQKKAIKTIAKKAAVRAATGAAMKIIPRAVGVGAQTAINVPLVASNVAEKWMPEYELTRDESEQLAVEITGDDPSFVEALGKGFGSAYIELGSERTGAMLGKVGGLLAKSKAGQKLAKMSAPQRMMALKTAILKRFMDGGRTVAQAKEILRKSGWNGMIGEIFEERVGEVARGLTGIEDNYGTTGKLLTNDPEGWKQLGIEAAAFSVIPLGQTALSASEKAVAPKHIKDIERLSVLREKLDAGGIVSRADAAAWERITGQRLTKNQAERTEEVKQEFQKAKEAQDAQAVREDQGIAQEERQVGQGGEADSGSDIRRPGQEQVPTEPTGEEAEAQVEEMRKESSQKILDASIPYRDFIQDKDAIEKGEDGWNEQENYFNSVKNAVDEIAKRNGWTTSVDYESISTAYIDVNLEGEYGIEESFQVRVSNHKQRYGGPKWSFDPMDSEKQVNSGLETIENEIKATNDLIKKQSQQEPTTEESRPEPPPIPEKSEFQMRAEEMVSKAPLLNGSEVSVDDVGKRISIKLPTGHETAVHFDRDTDAKALAKNRGMKQVNGWYARQENKDGQFASGEIYLPSWADHTMLNHELVHWLQDIGVITEAETARFGKGQTPEKVREGFAKAYEQASRDGTLEKNGVFVRVMDFLKSMFGNVEAQDRRTFRDLPERVGATKEIGATETPTEAHEAIPTQQTTPIPESRPEAAQTPEMAPSKVPPDVHEENVTQSIPSERTLDRTEWTSIKKDVVNELRGIVDFPQVEGSTPQSVPEWANKAEQTLASDPLAAKRLVNELASNSKRAINQDEAMLLQFRYRELQNELEPLLDEYFNAINSEDPVAIATTKTAVVDARKKMTEFEEIIHPSKETWGRTGVALQQMLSRDFSPERILRRGQESNDGKPLNEKQQKELLEMSRKMQDIQDQLDAKTKQANDLEIELQSRNQHDSVIKESKQRKTAVKSEKRKAAENNVANALAEFKKAVSGRVGAGVPIDLLAPAVKVAKAYAQLGLVRFNEFIANIRRDLDKDVDEELFRVAWNKAREDGDIIDPKVDSDSPASLTREAQRIQKNLVDSGITDRDEVLNLVHESIREVIPEFTRRQTMDALSRYGQFTLPSQEEAAKTIRNMNSEILKMSQIDQLEIANKRIDELRNEGMNDEEIGKTLEKENLLVQATGLVRDKPTEAVRQLTKKYNELKKSIPSTEEEVAGRLQTAQNSMARSLSNRISEVKWEIEHQERIIKERKATPDNELTKTLRAELDELMKIHSEMFPAQRTDAQREQAALREIDRLEEQIRTKKFTEREQRKGGLREEIQNKLDRLRRQVAAAKNAAKEADITQWEGEGGSFAKDPELVRSERAARRLLEYMQKQEEAGFPPPQEKGQPLSSKELESTRKKIDEIRARRDVAQKEGKRVNSLNKQIATLEERLRTGEIAPKTKPTPYTTEMIEARIARRKQLQAELKARRAAEMPELAEARSRIAYEASLRKRIADYKQMLADGDFTPKPKKEPRKLSESELKLKREMEDIRHQVLQKFVEYHLANLHGIAWGADKIAEAAHLSRALMTSFDLSALLRQGGIPAMGHPILAKRALFETIASMAETFNTENAKALTKGMTAANIKKFLRTVDSRQAEFNFMHNLNSGEAGEFRIRAGLDLPGSDEIITKQEEAFQGRWGRKFPGVAISGRLYTMILNKLRADLFDSMVNKLGRNEKVTLEEAKVIADFVNIATGRADFGKFNDKAAALNTIFFAPRYVASRFQYLAMPFYLPFKGGIKSNWRVKRAIMKEYARTATGIGTVLGTFALTSMLFYDDDDPDKPTIELDPRSSDFLKVKIGDTRLDFMAGLQQAFVLSSRLAPGWMGGGKTKSSVTGKFREFGEGYKPTTRLSLVAQFARTKLAPVPGATATMLNDWTDVTGQKQTPLSLAKGLAVPLSLSDIKKTMEQQGVIPGAAMGILSILGVSMNTYGPKTQYIEGSEEERKEQFEKDLNNMEWDSDAPEYSEFLNEDQMKQVDKKRDEKKQNVVYNATAEMPIRENYKDEKAYESKLKLYQSNAEKFNSMSQDMTYYEANKLLIEHYRRKKFIRHKDKKGGKWKWSNEYRGRTNNYDNSYMDRAKALDKLYGKPEGEWRRWRDTNSKWLREDLKKQHVE